MLKDAHSNAVSRDSAKTPMEIIRRIMLMNLNKESPVGFPMNVHGNGWNHMREIDHPAQLAGIRTKRLMPRLIGLESRFAINKHMNMLSRNQGLERACLRG